MSYERLLAEPEALKAWDVDLIRVESPGENEAVARGLIALGGGPKEATLEFGEIGFGPEYHRGFCRLLQRIDKPCLNAPAEIAVMFDKWQCHLRFQQAGLPRPPAEMAPPSFAELEAKMKSGSGRLFLKPLHGSSASGVCALRWAPGRVQMMAPLRLLEGKLINSLQVSCFQSREEIAAILDRLLPQGMIAERWIPKLCLDQGVVDLRVLVIAGQACHRVVRQSRHPMTNLHLGNQRGDEAELRHRLGDKKWSSALHLAEQAAACFPGSLYAGVDILLDSTGRPWIGEINAFGDLLPNLTYRGESAYSALARACDAQSCTV